jgi:hypothetical protein
MKFLFWVLFANRNLWSLSSDIYLGTGWGKHRSTTAVNYEYILANNLQTEANEETL